MVGVAGKSKGCSTCRKRKKGCDLARPSCGQCLKSGNICGGYQRDLTFIHHKIPERNRQPSSQPKPGLRQDTSRLRGDVSSTTTSNWGSYTSSLALVQPPAASTLQGWDQCSALVSYPLSSSPSLQVLSPGLTLTALTILHTSLFNAVFLPRNSLAIQSSSLSSDHPASWTQFIPPLLNNDLSLQLAYLAISSSRIGHDNKDDNLLAASKKFYGKALREMQRAISDPKRRYREEPLLACSMLSLYEIFEAQKTTDGQPGLTPHGWLSHAAGVTRLLEARGPESYTTDKGHAVFLHARILTTLRASTGRKACFLSQPQWLTIPWNNHPKNMQHKLVDVMVFLPVVLETYDTMKTNTSHELKARTQQRRALLAKCVALCEQLQGWYNQLRADANGRSLWHTFPSNDPSYPFRQTFSFDNQMVAYTIMLYWTCSLVFQGTVHQLRQLLSNDLEDLHDAEIITDDPDPEYYAVNIAQSLPYFMHPDMAALGPNLALFPMGMAFGFFASPTRPSFVADWYNLRSTSNMLDGMMDGKEKLVDRSAKDIVRWFISLFADLRSRRLPGGTFLSGLMKAIGATPAH